MLRRFVAAAVIGLSLQLPGVLPGVAGTAEPITKPSVTKPGVAASAKPLSPQPETAIAQTGSSRSTLETVKARGRLRCGTSSALQGFGQVDAKGVWSGFDVDFCRAIAAAVFGDAEKVEFVQLAARQRFDALESGTVDVLAQTTTWTLSRETVHHLLFTGVDYYDGQGFIVRRDIKESSAADLKSDQICVAQDTTTELNLADYFRQRGLKYAPKVFAANDAEAAYAAGQCAALTTDASALFVLRARLPNRDDNIILPEIISKEPLGPAVRQGDDKWFEIVRWTLIAMIDAEEMGVSQANVDTAVKGDNPRIRRLLGVEGNFVSSLGLTADWAYRIIKFVGNYADVFERNLGGQSPLKIKRGLNDLWTHGGLLYAPPIL